MHPHPIVGSTVGTLEGSDVGSILGIFVRDGKKVVFAIDGTAEGSSVGRLEGIREGISEGKHVGSSVGILVGETVTPDGEFEGS